MIDMHAEQVDAIHLAAGHGKSARRQADDYVRAAAQAGDADEIRRWRRVRRLLTQEF